MSAHPIGNNQTPRLVILGAGYIGSALARDARARGQPVVALTRNVGTAKELEALGVRTVVADLASEEWHSQVGATDWVVNCVSSGGGGRGGYQHSYVDGLHSIRRWLARSGKVETLVYTSSTSVYPQMTGTVTESSPTNGGGNAALLVEAEEIVRAIAQEQLVESAVVLRLAGIYGPRRHHLLDYLQNSPGVLVGGKGEHRLNLIHRDDVVAAILAVLAKSAEGEVSDFEIFNVTDDAPMPKSDVVNWIAQQIGVAAPGFSGVPVPGRRSDPPDRAVSNEKIKQRLGWRPRFPNFKAGYAQILGA